MTASTMSPASRSARARSSAEYGGKSPVKDAGRAEDHAEPARGQPDRHVIHHVEDGLRVAGLAGLIGDLGHDHVRGSRPVGQLGRRPAHRGHARRSRARAAAAGAAGPARGRPRRRR